MPDPDEPLLAPDEVVDLDNCAREPIHIPGRVQPRGCLIALRAVNLVVLQCSTNVADQLGRSAQEILGQPLDVAIGASGANLVARHLMTSPRLQGRNPLLVEVDVDGQTLEMDAILHRPPTADGRPDDALVVIELERPQGPRPLTFGNTYEAVRDAVVDLNSAGSLDQIFELAARHVRTLTRFDRVMIYQFDADHNGMVVAEAKRADLVPFLGLRYPASDIPAQARALYEKSWIRLISDVAYTPSEIVPTVNPVRSAPLDLTHATLRSVSPLHLEYLANMGVRASMSISLMRDDRLWGLIACHHYAGPHEPSYGVRAAAEFLGSTLSLRLVAQVEEDRLTESRRAAAILARLVARSRDEVRRLGEALTDDDGLLTLTHADGVVLFTEGDLTTTGDVPDEPTCRALVDWVCAQEEEIVVTDSMTLSAPSLPSAPEATGMLAARLPDGQAVLWLRHETSRDVDWGGDPHDKVRSTTLDGDVRLSPRKSFDLWREVVRGHSEAWNSDVVDAASSIRSHLVEALYLRARRDDRAAEAMQRSMLPSSLPAPRGWTLEARYETADGGRIGGDWYDALMLPSGTLAAVVGDVAGHGPRAAAVMGQVRNALRAVLVRDEDPARAVAELDRVVRWILPDQFATVLVALVDLDDGTVRYASAGHPAPLLLAADNSSVWPRPLGSAPLGVLSGEVRSGRLEIPAGGGIAFFTDGLVERRTESLHDGVERLQQALTSGRGIDDAMALSHASGAYDDATLLILCRDR
ncbi:SpoIIE family protein phosphatase [Sanguibacter antarcticus]|uniref:Light-regulated signal transduction histidine kinase (Bacteriophytochrome) n=1 Tax=Sanguibacter antarcticus TaxID=372484 RepID=A0A2A9E7P4_9MICO|nr:SpoIIE family protein phosphatase [Sanguibacter antarcticus]PFG34252.1 light-regulated signal transduction histidine kinase (bacteriophytochrome) [Sanguibacter antarcticus]